MTKEHDIINQIISMNKRFPGFTCLVDEFIKLNEGIFHHNHTGGITVLKVDGFVGMVSLFTKDGTFENSFHIWMKESFIEMIKVYQEKNLEELINFI